MSYILGGVTLPDPRGYEVKYQSKETIHDMVNGASKRDISNIKRQFILSFTRLSRANAALILGLYNQKITLFFSSTETNNPIASTEVHVFCTGQKYTTKGEEYRSDIVLTLIEVQ